MPHPYERLRLLLAGVAAPAGAALFQRASDAVLLNDLHRVPRSVALGRAQLSQKRMDLIDVHVAYQRGCHGVRLPL